MAGWQEPAGKSPQTESRQGSALCCPGAEPSGRNRRELDDTGVEAKITWRVPRSPPGRSSSLDTARTSTRATGPPGRSAPPRRTPGAPSGRPRRPGLPGPPGSVATVWARAIVLRRAALRSLSARLPKDFNRRAGVASAALARYLSSFGPATLRREQVPLPVFSEVAASVSRSMCR